jgi:hypothetical protein
VQRAFVCTAKGSGGNQEAASERADGQTHGQTRRRDGETEQRGCRRSVASRLANRVENGQKGWRARRGDQDEPGEASM